MENLESYFMKQEEEVSNKYMSANGDNGKTDKNRKWELSPTTILMSAVVIVALVYAVKKIGFKPQTGD